MYSLSTPGVTYAHAAMAERCPEPGRGPAPLCGFANDDDTMTAEAAGVTCPDCLAAM